MATAVPMMLTLAQPTRLPDGTTDLPSRYSLRFIRGEAAKKKSLYQAGTGFFDGCYAITDNRND